jgi:Ca2+-binding EF-hand superfamily protein
VQFLAATVHQLRLDKDELLYKAFKKFDTDNSGFITRDELQRVLQAGGKDTAKVRGGDEDGSSEMEQSTAPLSPCWQWVFLLP